MNKNAMIAKINTAVADHDLDFDKIAKDTDMTAAELKDLLADVNDAVAEATAPPTFRIADLCRDLERDPKAVRASLRRMYGKDDAASLPQPIADASLRWTYLEEDREAVTSLISRD